MQKQTQESEIKQILTCGYTWTHTQDAREMDTHSNRMIEAHSRKSYYRWTLSQITGKKDTHSHRIIDRHTLKLYKR